MKYIRSDKVFYTIFPLIIFMLCGHLQAEEASFRQKNYYNSSSYNKNSLNYSPTKINLGLGGGVSPRNLISATVHTEVRGFFTQKSTCDNCSYSNTKTSHSKRAIPFALRTSFSNYSDGNSIGLSFRSWGLSGFFTVNYGFGVGFLDIARGKKVKPALNLPLGFKLRFSDNLVIESQLRYSLIFHKPTSETLRLNFSIFFPIFKY